MKLFVNGGGSGTQATDAYNYFGTFIDRTKPLLYVPFAMENERYPSCLEWITGEMGILGITIDMATCAQELSDKLDEEHCAVFIGGGNTYELLDELKKCGCLDKLKAFIENDGPVFGGSAGAIIFGTDISSAAFADPNDIGLKDTSALGLLGDADVFPHYCAEDQEQNHFLREYSKTKRVIALPEEDTLLFFGKDYQIIGHLPVYVFDHEKVMRL